MHLLRVRSVLRDAICPASRRAFSAIAGVVFLAWTNAACPSAVSVTAAARKTNPVQGLLQALGRLDYRMVTHGILVKLTLLIEQRD
jgi:hypothetical protein